MKLDIIGSVASGKTTLARYLSDNEIRKEIKKENEELQNQTIAKRNKFEIQC